MRFLADMGVRHGLWNVRKEGHDAIHQHEQGLERLTNIEIFKRAESETRISRRSIWTSAKLCRYLGRRGLALSFFGYVTHERCMSLNVCERFWKNPVLRSPRVPSSPLKSRAIACYIYLSAVNVCTSRSMP